MSSADLPHNRSEQEKVEAQQRRIAAIAGAKLVEPGMIVGLGTGKTANELVQELARRQHEEGLQFVGVPTSNDTHKLAHSLGMNLRQLDQVASLDLVIDDGADEVDDNYNLIKGRGGALLREKIVAAAARRRVIIVSPEKQVKRLGLKTWVPVEVSGFGLQHTRQALENLGATTAKVRLDSKGEPDPTDEGNYTIDCEFPEIADARELNSRLNSVPGVFETGLFVGFCDLLIVGHLDGAKLIECG